MIDQQQWTSDATITSCFCSTGSTDDLMNSIKGQYHASFFVISGFWDENPKLNNAYYLLYTSIEGRAIAMSAN